MACSQICFIFLGKQKDYISQPSLQLAVTRPALADELCAEVLSTCPHHRCTRTILLMFYLPR